MISKSSLRKIASILILIALIGIAIFYYTRHKDDFRLISSISVEAILILSGLVFISFFPHGFLLKVLTDHYRLNLTFPQWFGLSCLGGFAYLYLPFPSGASLKAVYLKKICGLRYSSFVASMAVSNIVKLAVYCFFTIVLLLLAGDYSVFLFGIVGTIFIGTLVFLLLEYNIPLPQTSLLNPVIHILREWHEIRKDQATIVHLIVLYCFIFAISSLSIYLSFKTFSIEAPILCCGVIFTFSAFVGIFKLVPADLGITEAIFMGVSSLFGVGMNEGLHAAALLRVIGTVLTLLVAPGFGYKLFKEVSFHEN